MPDLTTRNKWALHFLSRNSVEAAALWIRLTHAEQDADSAAKLLASELNVSIESVRDHAQRVMGVK